MSADVAGWAPGGVVVSVERVGVPRGTGGIGDAPVTLVRGEEGELVMVSWGSGTCPLSPTAAEWGTAEDRVHPDRAVLLVEVAPGAFRGPDEQIACTEEYRAGAVLLGLEELPREAFDAVITPASNERWDPVEVLVPVARP